MLASTREIAAYSHLSAPAVLEFPTGMSEIEALKIFRAGQDPMDTLKKKPRRAPRLSHEAYSEKLLGEDMQAFAQMLQLRLTGCALHNHGGLDCRFSARGAGHIV